MSAYVPGDIVKIVHRPRLGCVSNEGLNWASGMDKYFGDEFKVKVSPLSKYVQYKDWSWSDEWLQIVSKAPMEMAQIASSTSAGCTSYTSTGGGGGWGCAPQQLYVDVPVSNTGLAGQFAGFKYFGAGSSIKPITKIPMKLGTMLKKLLDKDTQTLYKAGLINGDLQLTSEGSIELMAILFEANKSVLVEAAQARLDEEKEDCKGR